MIVSKVRYIYKRLIPLSIRNVLSRFIYKAYINYASARSVFLLKQLKKKQEVSVLLFLYNVDGWKLHSLYQEFEKNDKFKPTVVICPIITKGDAFMLEKMRASIQFCEENNCNFFVAYDFEKEEVIDVKECLICDIVFFTNPNKLSGESLYIDNFDDCLTCYVPYSFRIDRLYEYEYNNRTVNKVWKCFYETELHKQLAEKYADNRGRNVFVSGFPYLDTFTNIKVSKQDDRKLIIWAPHWTIKGAQNTGLDWACFLDYCDLVLELADRYREKLSFVMKPHPFLFDTLRKTSVWGCERLDDYIAEWDRRENCRIETGDYIELFAQSDALIHDSGSFMTEYLLQNKPMAYTANTETLYNRFNLWGKEVLKVHQVIENTAQFECFIIDVIASVDLYDNERESLIVKNHLLNEELVSSRILSVILDNVGL